MVKVHGMRVHLLEIEETLRRVAGVAEVGVLPNVPEDRLETLLAFYTVQPGFEVSEDDLRRAAASVLPLISVPVSFHAVSELPRLPGGKLNRALLTQMLQFEPNALSESPAFHDEVEATLALIWQEVLNVTALPPGADFFQLGGDSLMVFRALNGIQSVFGAQLTVSEFFETSTLAEQADLLRRKIDDEAFAT
jgi:hypothetical protein